MTLRRITLAVVAAAALTAAAFAASAALGSGASPDKATSRNAASKGGPFKCHSKACVNFDDDGTMFANHNGVLSVTHEGTGIYCVVLKGVHVDDSTWPLLTIDYADSPDGRHQIATWSQNSSCADANAVRVRVFNASTGADADAAVNFMLP